VVIGCFTVGNQNLVDDTVGRSENLSVLVQRHLADIEGLHGEMIESVSSLKSDYSYLMGISKLMSDFQLEMAGLCIVDYLTGLCVYARDIKLTQVYSRYPCEKPLIERVFVKAG